METKIWRERCFILIADPSFNFFEDSIKFHGIFVSVYISVFRSTSSNIPAGFEGFNLMTAEELKKLPQSIWMSGGSKPKLEDYLGPKLSDADKNRLHMIGNVVCPQMAHLACHILAGMWWGLGTSMVWNHVLIRFHGLCQLTIGRA